MPLGCWPGLGCLQLRDKSPWGHPQRSLGACPGSPHVGHWVTKLRGGRWLFQHGSQVALRTTVLAAHGPAAATLSFQGRGIYSKGEPRKAGIGLEPGLSHQENRRPASTENGNELGGPTGPFGQASCLFPALTLTDAGILSGFMPRDFQCRFSHSAFFSGPPGCRCKYLITLCTKSIFLQQV